MPRAKIRLEASGQGGVSHAFVQLKKMRMPPADPDPDDLRPAFRVESSDTRRSGRKKAVKRMRRTDAQFLLRSGIHIAEKSEGEMNLFAASQRRPGNSGFSLTSN